MVQQAVDDARDEGADYVVVLSHIGIANLPAESGDFPQVSGVRFSVDVASHSISGVELLQADGSYSPLDPTATYTIGSFDYVITGAASTISCPHARC